MNVYDSDKMKDIFISHNVQPTDDYLNADFVVLNTCHIREKATEKTFSDLGRINKKGKKDQKVIVAGCVAQAEGELIQKRAPYVDLVIGPQSIQSLDHFLENSELSKNSVTEFDVVEIFGETIDIHGGGEDLRFPHHENECAQSFCRNDGKQLANFWLHNGMVQMADSKMSKSLGNILLIKDLLNDMPGEVIRLSLMSSHYRQPLKWSDELVNQSKKTLDTFYSFLEQYENVDIIDTKINEEILNSLSDDINTPKAISVLHSIFKDLKKDSDNIELRSSFIKSANFMGLLFSKPSNWLLKEDNNIDTQVINELIKERNQARQSKDFLAADKIRNKLLDMGVVLEDKNDITTWKKKND